MNQEEHTMYKEEHQIKFKATMLRSSLCDYSDAYIFVKRKTKITGAGDDTAAREADESDKGKR